MITSPIRQRAEMRWRDYFRSFGYEILSYKGPTCITYTCSCGALHTTVASSFFKTDKKCPRCRVNWNFNPDKLPDRGTLYKWKKEVLKRDNFECKLCPNSEQLHVHHIEAYASRPDLAMDITNGITLCSICHINLHSLYGNNVGKDNLLRHVTGEL